MKIDFEKGNGLVPVIIQHNLTEKVLMLGYMNEEAFQKTIKENRVTFFSRSKNRLWTKGETSGNFLNLVSIKKDCDSDALLASVIPNGATCHNGTVSCFDTNKEPTKAKGFLYELENVVHQRIDDNDTNSYTNKIYRKGINKVAQKVGEEAVELVIEAKDDNKKLFLNEAADLLYHFLILLKAKNFTLEEVEQVLKERHK